MRKFYFICNFFFQSCYPIFQPQKCVTYCKGQNKKKNHDNWSKNKKVIQSQKLSKKCLKDSKFLV